MNVLYERRDAVVAFLIYDMAYLHNFRCLSHTNTQYFYIFNFILTDSRLNIAAMHF